MIIIINGPSGSGKTTLGDYFKELGLREIISTTTRPPRDGEVDGESYHFVTREQFLEQDRIEESVYAGNYYGVTRKEVEEKVRDGHSAFASLDINGVKRFKEIYGDEVIVIYIQVSRTLLKKRMSKRGDSVDNIRQRLAFHKTTREDLNGLLADYVIYNHDSLRNLKNQGRRILEAEGIIKPERIVEPEENLQPEGKKPEGNLEPEGIIESRPGRADSDE